MQRAVRSLIIVLAAPSFKDDLRFEQAAEQLPVEALAAQLAFGSSRCGRFPTGYPA